MSAYLVKLVVFTAREREQRERLRDLAIFERLNGNVARTSAALAVKKVRHCCTNATISGYLHIAHHFIICGKSILLCTIKKELERPRL